MKNKKEKQKLTTPKDSGSGKDEKRIGAKIIVPVFFLVLLIISIVGFEYYYNDRILPNTYVGVIDAGNMTKQQLFEKLIQEYNKWEEGGIKFTVKDKESEALHEVILQSSYIEEDTGLEFKIVDFDYEKMVDQAYSATNTDVFWTSILKKLQKIFFPTKVDIAFIINENKIPFLLEQKLSSFVELAKDANLEINFKEDGSYIIEIIKEKQGKTYDYEKAIGILEDSINNNEYKSIELEEIISYPVITFNQIEKLKSKANDLMKYESIVFYTNDDFTVNSEGKIEWIIDPTFFGSWVLVNAGEDNNPELTFNKDIVYAFLDNTVTSEVNQEPIDAVFEMDGDKVSKFQPSENGKSLNKEKTYQNLLEQVFQKESTVVELSIEETLPEISTADSNKLGINEVIGIGESDFSGSPANRRHNIAVGAAAVNGTVIPPDEEFSLLSVLGEINAATGYLPELVIKEGKTIPEYGGGLCQIGTTAFRSAVHTGLPITERRNHSYQVSYYFPSGTDATIYSPSPDFKFLNDTPGHILITTHIDGSILTYRFWGTDDGRKVTTKDPVSYAFVSPPPTKIIETLDLAPGVKRCTEGAHTGAKSEWTRKIVYSDGEEKEETWYSHYKPWQAVCLLGVEELIPEEGEQIKETSEIPQEQE